MVLSARARLTVPFHDVDVMHIAWHGHYLKYFEIGRTALMQSLGLDWPQLREEGIAMPIVEAHAQYRKAIAYGQDFWVEASIEAFDYPELKVLYRILSTDAEETLFTTGWTRQVYLSTVDQSLSFNVPDFILNRLRRAEVLR